MSVEDVPSRPGLRVIEGGVDAPSPWVPAVLDADRDEARHASLREARAGVVLTSYTRMKALGGARAGWDEEPEQRRSEKAAREVGVDASGDVPLRAARASGVFVHEVLERVPLGSFAAATRAGGLDAWREDPHVAAVVTRAMTTHRIASAERPHAERLVWTAFTTPLPLPGGGVLPSIASALRVAREMDFVFPVPDARAYVRGAIDLAFEHEGLTYFVDWKTDSLGSFDREALHRHVAAQYEDQLELYALATVKLLGIESAAEHGARFGGLLYVFLRGLGPGGAGVWSSAPSFADVGRWDAALALRARRP